MTFIVDVELYFLELVGNVLKTVAGQFGAETLQPFGRLSVWNKVHVFLTSCVGPLTRFCSGGSTPILCHGCRVFVFLQISVVSCNFFQTLLNLCTLPGRFVDSDVLSTRDEAHELAQLPPALSVQEALVIAVKMPEQCCDLA